MGTGYLLLAAAGLILLLWMAGIDKSSSAPWAALFAAACGVALLAHHGALPPLMAGG